MIHGRDGVCWIPWPVAPNGTSTIEVKTLPCAISGWALVRAIEATPNGKDRFAPQTCEEGSAFSVFFPKQLPADKNHVHVFFAANGAKGDVSNAATCFALRAACENSTWILITVEGNDQGVNRISAAEIVASLKKHGRPDRIDKLRMSSHSRGFFALNGSLRSKLLVAPNGVHPVVTPDAVDRIVLFDSDSASTPIASAVKGAGVDITKLFGFWVTVWPVSNWSTPRSQTIDLISDTDVKKGVRAVAYGRLVEDARILRPTLNIPPDIDQLVKQLALPSLGSFTTRAGTWNFKDYCRAKRKEIEAAVGPEVEMKSNSKLYKFIDSNDLARVGHTGISPGIWHHHLFVAEFAHEVTDSSPPSP